MRGTSPSGWRTSSSRGGWTFTPSAAPACSTAPSGRPTEEVVAHPSGKRGLAPDKLTLLVAPTASLAGTVQVVARSLETALHKLHELKFDLGQVVSGFGTAPLPPPAQDDLAAVGRTNDAILYGGRVHLWVRADDGQLEAVGPQVPASASRDYGLPFAELFA